MWIVLGFLLMSRSGVALPDSTKTAVIRHIFLEGNHKTRAGIIMRELAVKSGDTVRVHELADILEVDRRKVVNTNLFVTVQFDPEFTGDSSQVDLRLKLRERWYIFGLPVFQLADRNFNEWWYDRNRDFSRITYGLYGSHNNVSGRNDKLKVLVELGFVPKYEISYSFPYLDRGMKLGLTAGASYSTNKSLAVRTWNDKLDFLPGESVNRRRFYFFISPSYRSKFYGYHMLDVRWVNATVSDTVLIRNPHYLFGDDTRQRFFQFTYTYSYNKRDIGQYPLRGYNVVFQASKRGVLPGDDVNQGYLYGVYRHFLPLGGRFFFNSGVRLRASFPARVPYLNMVGLGYRLDLVRGYELYVIDGQHYGVLQNELKFRLFDVVKTIKWLPRQFGTVPVALYLNAFADAGYISNKVPEWSNSRLSNRLLAGTGLGLDLVTFYNLVYRLNYSFSAEGERRLFFSVAREF
ncbi:BamA/TamA family outer membrane protein [Ravibacter arvi]|uniref:BamA/TamA family outer membrane protein n=1 Tax=Ravibacter arvi TaxID=2051041 RepID=UPI0031F13EDB